MKIGVVGTGMIVRMVCPNLKSWGIDVTAVAGTPNTMDQVNELADEWGAAGRYADYHDLVADPGVDTVYVAVPNFLHYAVSEAAILAGKDVVCEKPLASNEREAAKLAELAKEHRRFLWEGVVNSAQSYWVGRVRWSWCTPRRPMKAGRRPWAGCSRWGHRLLRRGASKHQQLKGLRRKGKSDLRQ